MKYARIPFSIELMQSNGGIPTDLFSQMFSKLPSDSKIMGFGQSNSTFLMYIFVSSDSFKDIPETDIPPDITVSFKRLSDGFVICDNVIYDNINPSNSHIHKFAVYDPGWSKDVYCKKCKLKQ